MCQRALGTSARSRLQQRRMQAAALKARERDRLEQQDRRTHRFKWITGSRMQTARERDRLEQQD